MVRDHCRLTKRYLLDSGQASANNIILGRFKKFPGLVYFTKNVYIKNLHYISFQVVYFGSYTLLPTFIKFMETFLKPILKNLIQMFRQLHHWHPCLVSFQSWFQMRKQARISWCLVRSVVDVWEMLHCVHIVYIT